MIDSKKVGLYPGIKITQFLLLKISKIKIRPLIRMVQNNNLIMEINKQLKPIMILQTSKNNNLTIDLSLMINLVQV